MRTSHLLAALVCPATLLASPLALPVKDGPRLNKRECSNPPKRVEWRNMQESDRQAYLEAEKCLFTQPGQTGLPGATSRNQDLAAVHQNMTETIHGVGQFLPWHRYMLYAHEYLLRTECGYTGPMTWWDETKDAGNFEHAPLFTSEYFGSAPTSNQCITDGAFANQELTVGPGTGNTQHCLSRGIDEKDSAAITSAFVNECNGNSNYTSMWQCVVPGPHGYGHDAMGGVMADVDSSPGDPIFFMHHGFIDRNWRIWQEADTADRLYQINGYTTQNCKTGCQETTLEYELDIHNIIGGATVNDMMDTTGGMLCYVYDY